MKNKFLSLVFVFGLAILVLPFTNVQAGNGCGVGGNNGKINIDTPNGGEIYSEGDTVTVYWETCDIQVPTDKVNIKLAQVDSNMNVIGTPIMLAKHVADNGHADVTLPQVDQTGLYIIGIRRENGKVDLSDSYFKILDSTETGTITLLSNSATVYAGEGDNFTVSWTTDNVSLSASMVIKLKNADHNYTLTNGTPNDGSESFKIPINLAIGDYTLEIYTVNPNQAPLVDSSGLFSFPNSTAIDNIATDDTWVTGITDTKATVYDTYYLYNGMYLPTFNNPDIQVSYDTDPNFSAPTIVPPSVGLAINSSCSTACYVSTAFPVSISGLTAGTTYYYKYQLADHDTHAIVSESQVAAFTTTQ